MVHLHPVAIKFVFLEFNRLSQRLTLLGTAWGGITARVHTGFDRCVIHAAIHTQSGKNWAEFADGLVGTGDNLLGNRCAFY